MNDTNPTKLLCKMDSVKRSSVTPNKSRLARTFAKVMHIRAATGIAPDDGVSKIKSRTELKNSLTKNSQLPAFDAKDEKLRERAVKQAFVAKLFATISSVKAAYAELQHAQTPYDPDGIHSADDMIILELKNLSELKQCYLKKQFDVISPETTQLLAEIQEQKNLLKTYEIMGKKLDSQVKLKDSEITFLREKLEETNKENKLLEKRLNSSGFLSVADNLQLSSLSPSHFTAFLKQTVKSIRSFVRLFISEIESAGWDLDAAASSIEPGVVFWKPSHRCFAFESFVCREMFDGFNYPHFSISKEPLPEQNNRRQQLFLDRFMELNTVKATDYLAWKPTSTFAKFCRAKYLRLVHPKLEASIFSNLNQRNLINSGEYPETAFFSKFADMAKRVWLLHCLAFSFAPEASIFQVSNRSRFSEVYMESVNDEAFIIPSNGSPETDPRVAFMVVPGFTIQKTVIQCQVYLR